MIPLLQIEKKCWNAAFHLKLVIQTRIRGHGKKKDADFSFGNQVPVSLCFSSAFLSIK